MRCSACGHQNDAGASFCNRCGSALAAICADCGRRNPPHSWFCAGCGVRLGDAALTAPPAAARPAVGGTATPALPTGFVGGRYRVTRLLGEGARKRVYLAHDERLDRDVAFALVRTEGLDDAGRTRIRREAQAMGRLGDHPHVVTVHDIGEEHGQPYIVSQYMPGGSVQELLQRTEQHRLPIAQCLQIADELAQALEHAHARGVIHRDLKSANVWIAADGGVKLGDFGLAMAVDRSRLTSEGMMVGTVAYMPPEQALGRPAEARSDLYSLGAMLYEMVTGRPPFLGDDAVVIISQHINTPPVAPSWHNPDVPRALEALVLRLLAKAPEDRPASAAVVREALKGVSATASASANVAAADANPLDRLAGGVFVGREREMDELRATLEEALSGRGRLVLLAGEPGIGKTRTAEEFTTYARLRKAQVLWGRCYEGEGTPAYWPWVQAIRAYVHERDPKQLLSELGSAASDIAQVVSEVGERLPGLPAPPPMSPEQARFRLFDGITAFLRNASKSEPLVLCLDDLHWADKPSLLLLQFLARELRRARLVVVGTFRDVELGRQHPLAQTLAELTREQLSQRIMLRGLGEHDVGRFIEITAGIKPPAALVATVYKETEGNPFFVNEVVRLLASEGRLQHPEQVTSWSVDIPQGVREVVTRRLDRLSGECNRVLTIAAVIGREFTLELLEKLVEYSSDRLLEVLEEATAARVIAEVPRTVGRYSFAHALIRETLVGELTTTRRVRLHRQIGEALEALYGSNPEPHLAELAHHFFEAAPAGDVEKGIDYARRAAARAARLLAYEEAARLYEVALTALELRDPPDERQRCELLLALGHAQWNVGQGPAATDTFERAAAVAEAIGAPELLAQAADGCFAGTEMAVTAVDDRLLDLLQRALKALGDAETALRARVLSRLVIAESSFAAVKDERLAHGQLGVEIARRVGDRGTLALALSARQMAVWGVDDLDERLAIGNEVVRLAEQVNESRRVLDGRFWRFFTFIEAGDRIAAEREMKRFGELAEAVRIPYHLWFYSLWRGMWSLLGGRFEEAEMHAQEALGLGQRVHTENAVQCFGAQLLFLRWHQGRLEELEPMLAGAAEETPEWRRGIAYVYCELGRDAEARKLFEQLAANDFADMRRDVSFIPSLAFLSEIASRLGDRRRAALLYELLEPYAGRNILLGPGLVCHGSASRYLAMLATSMSRWDDAARHFEVALERNARFGARPMLAQTQHDYAAMIFARGDGADRRRSLELLNEALETAQQLGMRGLVERALTLKLRVQGMASAPLETSIDAVAGSVQRERPDLHRHAAPDGTVTILFSDIEGSTAMIERLGDRRWLEILRAHNAIVREHVAVHGGFEVKAQGDGFMVAFQSGLRALRCAIAIQQAFAAYNAAHPEEPLRVRIGLHAGEIFREADDFFGKNVVLAARVAAQAEGGEILVSSLLRELTESAGEFVFEATRDVELKGIAGMRQVAAVAWSAGATID